MQFALLPDELQERFLNGTGWNREEFIHKSPELLWKMAPSLTPEQSEWLYQLLFGIPTLRERLKEAVSSVNCQTSGISGAWQEAADLIVRYGHHEDLILKKCAAFILRGYDERAHSILEIRSLLK